MFESKVSTHTTYETDETINKLNGKIDMLLELLGYSTLDEAELQYNEKHEVDLFSKDESKEIALIDEYSQNVCRGNQCSECVIEKIKRKLNISYIGCDIIATLLYLKKNKLNV